MVLKNVVDARPPSTAEQLTTAINILGSQFTTDTEKYSAWRTIATLTGADIEEVDDNGEQCVVWDDGSLIILTPPEEVNEEDSED